MALAARADARAVAVVPATLDKAIARRGECQVDSDAGGHHGADERAAVASQVLGEAALHVTVQGNADVVAGMAVGPREAQ